MTAQQAEPKFASWSLEAAKRTAGNSCPGSGVYSQKNAGAGTLGGGGEWQAVRGQAGIKVDMSYIDNEGARRCVISGMLIGKRLLDTLWNERTWL